jgi:membrane associated rhomboid family serine protease
LTAGGPSAVVRVAARERHAAERALVLQAEGLEASVRRTREGFVLETTLADAERARELLAAWERENVREPAPRTAPLPPYPWNAVAIFALALLGFFALTGPRAGGSAWFALGSARASRILGAGEWWRALTALTLHADLAHVLGNVLAGAVFVGNVWRRFGAGVGLALLLAAGGLGNLANAFAHRGSGHDSVGASTAVFAAVGVLAADALLRRRAPRGRALVPLGAGLGILAMLGTGERADFGAHLVGLPPLALASPAARPPRPAARAGPTPRWRLL